MGWSAPISLVLFIALLMLIGFVDGFFWAFYGDNLGLMNWFENERGFAKCAYAIFISAMIYLNLRYFIKGIK